MRRVPIFLILLLPFVAFSQSQTFEVFGTITGEYNSNVYLFYDGNYKQKDSISAEIKDGKFYIKATAPLPIQGRFHLGQQSYLQDIYLDGRKIFITCANKFRIYGKDNDTLNVFEITSVKRSKIEDLKREFETWLTSLNASDKTEKENNQQYYDRLYALVQKHPNSKISPYLVGKASSLRYSQVSTLSGLIDNSLTNTFEGKSVAKLLNSLDNSKNKAIGTAFRDVMLRDTAGVALSTKDLRGKYVLVDFWASWCKPCRETFPALKRLYDTFKGKDFEIVGISFDNNEDKWKGAIVKDGLPWMQVIDEKGFSGTLGIHYEIEAIPASILIDKEGKIMGVGLSPKEIEEMIGKLL